MVSDGQILNVRMLTYLFGVIGGEESNGGTLCSCTTCSTNTVNIVLRVVGIVIVEDMSNVSNIFFYGLAISADAMKSNGADGLYDWSCETGCTTLSDSFVITESSGISSPWKGASDPWKTWGMQL